MASNTGPQYATYNDPQHDVNESWLDLSPISPEAPIFSNYPNTAFQPMPAFQHSNDSQDTLAPIIDSYTRRSVPREYARKSWHQRLRESKIPARGTSLEHRKWFRVLEGTQAVPPAAQLNEKRISYTSEKPERKAWYANVGPMQNGRPWYQNLNPLKWSPPPEIPTKPEECPEHTANPLSKMVFAWVTPLMASGYRRSLESNDIWTINPDRNINKLSDPFKDSFQTRQTSNPKRLLLMSLYETFKRDFWIGGICVLISSLGQVMVPFTLRFLLAFVADAYKAATLNQPGPPIGEGLGILFAIVFIQLVQSLSTNQFLYRGGMVGAQARGVLTTAIFEKSLRISARARAAGKGYSDGRIMNLMSTDVARIDLAAGMIHMIWAAPLTILACLILLIINITYSAVAGFSLLVISIPLLTIATKSLAGRRKDISSISDSRVSLVSEVLKSIRFVKYNAWELPFLAKLQALRKKETILVAKLLTTRNAIYVISISTPVFAAMLSFIVYSMTGHSLDVGPVFSSLALFNAVRIPLALLPIVIGQMADAMACLKRIEEFLSAEDHMEQIQWDVHVQNGIEVKRASFCWEKAPGESSESPTPKKDAGKKKNERLSEKAEAHVEKLNPQPFSIRDISFSVGRNELLAVVGSVGSGKTSLLSALAGEMRLTNGDVIMGSWSRAVCPQQAWIQNATVKDNILFGKPMDERWYKRVKDACSLSADMQQLSAGEDTEIGERGINLSGGQRQRINLARAIYSKSDIILLDDPLSAVDVHVGKHLFDEAICGLLRDKCRILATHQLHVLSRCDRILWLDDGNIKALDTYSNLFAQSSEFRQMMANTVQEDTSAEQKQEISDKKEKASKGSQETKETKAKEESKGKKDGKLVKEESKGEGHVSWAVYKAYIASSGHLLLGLIPVVLLILAQVANAVMGMWLGFWSSNRFKLSRDEYIAIYVGLATSQAILMFFFTASISNLGSISSRRTLDSATDKIIRSPQSFHDTQPLGRIITRLSRDADVVDNQLPDALRMFLYTVVLISSVIALLMYYFPYFGIALVPILAVFLFATSYFRVTARSLKRHEAVLRSKLFARFSESVSGASTIRAFGLQTKFTTTIREAIDGMNRAYYLTKASERWLATRLDLVANTMVLTVGLLVVISRDAIEPSISGVLLAYLLSMIHVIQLVVRQLAEVQTGMNSMERLHEYATTLEVEPEMSAKTFAVRDSWPERGEINMQLVQMRYREDLPLVLNNLNVHIRGGERIGIVGRTGAGKSSITQVLFRLVELAGGRVMVDDVDISTVALSRLRSSICIITQDPTLFKGTIRSNLDPFDQRPDMVLWDALRTAGLLDDEKTKVQLDTAVEESGSNFSLGQRQLLALARALLHDSKIVVCDEATSSVDMETDAKVQRVMANAFAGKTVLTIAHRLKTILDYDKVCIMDKGSVLEFGSPWQLWQKGEVFKEMCVGNGIERAHFGR